MENASKALLIAGSILIVILLIAMGMRVFNSTAGTEDNVETTMNATEIATFNTKFTAYAGAGKSTSQVIALANVVNANNSTNSTKIVIFKIAGTTYSGPANITNAVSSLSGTHKIEFEYDTNGLVSIVHIDKPTT